MQMEVTIFKKYDFFGNWVICQEGTGPMTISDVVRQIIRLLGTTASLNRIERAGDLALDVVDPDKGTYRGVYHSFSDPKYAEEIVACLKASLFSRSRIFGVLEEDRKIGEFMLDFMPRFLDSPENDVEKKLKAVLAVITYGGARTREDMERLVELKWWKLLAVVRLARSEQMSAVEVLDFLEPVVAA